MRTFQELFIGTHNDSADGYADLLKEIRKYTLEHDYQIESITFDFDHTLNAKVIFYH